MEFPDWVQVKMKNTLSEFILYEKYYFSKYPC